MRILYIFCISIFSLSSYAQPSADIYLFNFRLDSNSFYISNARNITSAPGYDGQPTFTADGENIFFVSDDGFDQTDIFKYIFKSGSIRRQTFSPESEYSPTLTPNEKGISCVILKKNGNRELYKYPKNGVIATKISNKTNIGNYTWLNDSIIYTYLLGNPTSLESLFLPTKSIKKIVENLGGTILKIPNTNKISFIDMSNKNQFFINVYDKKTQSIKKIIHTLSPKDVSYAWTTQGVLVSSDGQKLYKFDPTYDKDWIELANLGNYGISGIRRIAINPKNNIIALEAAE